MKITTIQVNVGRKILHDQNEHSIAIGLQVEVEPEEDTESVYYSVKNTLEGQLDTWEHQVRTTEQPSVVTIPELTVTESPPLVTASDIKPKGRKTKNETLKPQYIQKHEEEEEQEQLERQEQFICPTCGEQMMPKEGKDYYLCTKHWGYPDMIKKGNVRERKF